MLLIPDHFRPELSAEEQERLTNYAIITRYPGDYDVQIIDAKRALRITRRVRNQVRDQMPGLKFRTRK